MPEDLESGEKRVKLFNSRNGWEEAGSENGKGTYSPWDVELLHDAGEHFSGVNRHTVFLSPILFRVSQLCLLRMSTTTLTFN